MVIWHCSHLAVNTFNVTYICQLNCHVRVWHGKTRDFIIDGTIYWVRLFKVSVFERKEFFLLRNIGKIDRTFKSVRAIHCIRPGKLTGLSNQFEPSMVFDRSEFEAPRLLYINLIDLNMLRFFLICSNIQNSSLFGALWKIVSNFFFLL